MLFVLWITLAFAHGSHCPCEHICYISPNLKSTLQHHSLIGRTLFPIDCWNDTWKSFSFKTKGTMFTTSELTCLAKAVSTSSFLTANIFKALMVQNPARKVNTMHSYILTQPNEHPSHYCTANIFMLWMASDLGWFSWFHQTTCDQFCHSAFAEKFIVHSLVLTK